MPAFDPTQPVADSDLISAPIRDNFNALKQLIDAVPPGPVGPPGPAGSNGADGRSVVNVYDDGSGRCVVQLSDGTTFGPFSIASGPTGTQGMQGPQGDQGPAGPQGNNGSDGPPGPQGPQGNNGNDGRYVSNIYDDGSGRAVIQMSDGGTYGPFTVASGPQGMPGPQGNNGNDGAQGPQGYNGSDGAQGPQGPQGNNGNDGRYVMNVYDDGSGRAIIQMSDGSSFGPFSIASGPQGAPGEVTAAAMNTAIGTAIGGTSANTNAIGFLAYVPSDPPTAADWQALADKVNELIAALRR